MTTHRLFISRPLSAGAEIALDEAQARHVGTVLRLEPGHALHLFNASDGEWRATVRTKSKRGMSVRVEALARAPVASPDLNLLFAPVKRHATDLIVEKATELGVRCIRPVITQRTIAETVRLDRLQSIAREAAEQTVRFDVPKVCEPLSLPRALDGWDAARRLVFCDEAGDAVGLLDALVQLPPSPRGEGAGVGEKRDQGKGHTYVDTLRHRETSSPTLPPNPLPSRGGGTLALLIGPEGGFTPEERAMLRACAFVTPVSLGPRILRADTAAIAALSIIQAAWGDWRQA